ncbi:hypothetical protein BHE90_001333 [Fusarium euwallaceae]|uniref:Uncharacterized protein n=2 Tax=Fusarium solani species complex TaxID=232080 RepID=A0A430M847_9HYPO|nr:hypothetical protein CEP51_007135 [Fusarium floridanum]RTE84123.1 hypothetical protein BHE90_001333 [Fusarium euwallaceae]
MGKLYYFQAPTLDINPENPTAPRLGGIYATLETLTGPLNQADHVNVRENLKNMSSNIGFEETVGNKWNVSLGVSAGAAQGLPGTTSLVYAFARDKQNVYSCELLETVSFEPTKEYVSESILASSRVQSFLQDSLFGRKRVYMVTGLKIATGFSKSSTRGTQHGPKLEIGVDATAVGVPVQAGVQLEFGTGNERTISHGRSTNKIVFAYRVIRIKVKRDGEPDYKYRSGGKYDFDEDSDEDEDEEDKWDLEPLDESDILKDFPDSVKVEIDDKGNHSEAVQV